MLLHPSGREDIRRSGSASGGKVRGVKWLNDLCAIILKLFSTSSFLSHPYGLVKSFLMLTKEKKEPELINSSLRQDNNGLTIIFTDS